MWNVYSYVWIGLIHQYDIYGFNLTPERMEILDTMWMSFIVSNIINSLLLLISILQKLILICFNISFCNILISNRRLLIIFETYQYKAVVLFDIINGFYYISTLLGKQIWEIADGAY